MWNETVEHNGQTVLRFRRLSREERISFYEVLFDEVSAAVGADGHHTSEIRTSVEFQKTHAAEIDQKLRMLENYYTSGQWRDDYEADEQGLLPDDLKRGILSQDALYDLLTEK